MATIVQRKRADGTVRYRAQIRIKRGGRVVYSESRTSAQRKNVERWQLSAI